MFSIGDWMPLRFSGEWSGGRARLCLKPWKLRRARYRDGEMGWLGGGGNEDGGVQDGWDGPPKCG